MELWHVISNSSVMDITRFFSLQTVKFLDGTFILRCNFLVHQWWIQFFPDIIFRMELSLMIGCILLGFSTSLFYKREKVQVKKNKSEKVSRGGRTWLAGKPIWVRMASSRSARGCTSPLIDHAHSYLGKDAYSRKGKVRAVGPTSRCANPRSTLI